MLHHTVQLVLGMNQERNPFALVETGIRLVGWFVGFYGISTFVGRFPVLFYAVSTLFGSFNAELMVWLVLWHINLCRLFNAKSIFM